MYPVEYRTLTWDRAFLERVGGREGGKLKAYQVLLPPSYT